VTELPAIVRLAHELRVSGVAAVHMMHFPQAAIDPSVESLQHHQERCNRMLAEARSVAAKLSLPLELPQPFARSPLPHRPVHRDFVGIDPDGWVSPCGWWHGDAPMGNIRTETFEQIWTRGYAGPREELQSGRLRSLCRDCPAAGMGSVDESRAFATRSLAASTAQRWRGIALFATIGSPSTTTTPSSTSWERMRAVSRRLSPHTA